MKCEKCGYILQSFEEYCPRCAHRESAKCGICGQKGISGTCRQCHKEFCAQCLPTEGGLCLRCEPQQYGAQGVSATVAEPAAQMLRQATYSRGFFDSVGRAISFIKESMGMAFRDKDLLLPSLFAFLINGVLIGAVLLAAHLTGNLDNLLSDEEKGFELWKLALFAALAFVTYTITYFFMGMTVNLVNARLHGRDAVLKVAFADAMKNAGSLLTLAAASTVVALITSAMRDRRGGRSVGNLAASAIEKGWAVITYLLVPIIILEDVPFKESITRGKSLHGRNFVPIAVGEIAVTVVNRILITIVGLLFGGVAFYLFFVGQKALLVPVLIVGAIVFIGTICFTEYIRTSYYTCLYLWAVAREREGETAQAPAPLATALAR